MALRPAQMPFLPRLQIDFAIDVDHAQNDKTVVVAHAKFDGQNFVASGANQTEALMELAIFLNTSGVIS